MDKVEVKTVNNLNAPQENHYSATWLMRRTIADFTEPLFYGNYVAAIFLLVGVSIDWILNPAHSTGVAMVLPAILLSQFISGGVGIFLYTNKYVELGWYATYVPVVSTGAFIYAQSRETLSLQGVGAYQHIKLKPKTTPETGC